MKFETLGLSADLEQEYKQISRHGRLARHAVAASALPYLRRRCNACNYDDKAIVFNELQQTTGPSTLTV
jgi:hypothetical protein